MIAHHYQMEIYESMLDYTHGFKQTQDRLYFPEKGKIIGRGVIGYRAKGVDFFSDEMGIIMEANLACHLVLADPILTFHKESPAVPNSKYIGTVEVPDPLADELINYGKEMNRATKAFHESGKKLVELLEDKK